MMSLTLNSYLFCTWQVSLFYPFHYITAHFNLDAMGIIYALGKYRAIHPCKHIWFSASTKHVLINIKYSWIALFPYHYHRHLIILLASSLLIQRWNIFFFKNNSYISTINIHLLCVLCSLVKFWMDFYQCKYVAWKCEKCNEEMENKVFCFVFEVVLNTKGKLNNTM